MPKNDLVVKSNQVIEASYTLTTIEQRLILSAIAQIPKGEPVTDEVIYTVSVADLQKFGANETTAYRDLKESVSRLFDRSIVLRSSDRTSRTRWVQKIDFMDSRGVIGIRFSKDILPFLSNLSTEFTKYLASDLIGVTSTYAIRLYELLVQYQSIGKREISVVDLRWMFELQNKYPVWADLKRWVIDQAVKEINEFSPLSVTYDEEDRAKNHKYQSKVQAEAKTSSNCHRNAKKRSDRGNTAKTTYRASNRKIQRNFEQIRQYFGLIKLS